MDYIGGAVAMVFGRCYGLSEGVNGPLRAYVGMRISTIRACFGGYLCVP